MFVGLALVELRIPGSRSLKDKRACLQRVTSKLRRDLRVSVSEVGDQELWGNATLGLATVQNTPTLCEHVLDAALRLVESYPELELWGSTQEVRGFPDR